MWVEGVGDEHIRVHIPSIESDWMGRCDQCESYRERLEKNRYVKE